LLDLHTHTRETYGPIFDEGRADWAAEFEPRVRDRYENIEGKIDTRTYARIDDILRAFPVIFADQGAPTLVHGDIWATNVMISERAGDWHLKGFVDVAGSFYADVEFELAYLEAFQPIWGPLLTRYAETTPFREGYALRRAAYHLNTMIIHVDHFGDAHYVRRTEQLADEIGAALGL
jgi:fructosamine-3-kinase